MYASVTFTVEFSVEVFEQIFTCEFALSFLQDCPLLCVKEDGEKVEHPPGAFLVTENLKIANSKAREAASKEQNEVS